jgi:hypothetical protein
VRVGLCNTCHTKEQDVVMSKFILDFLEQLEHFKKPLQERMDWMKIRIDRKFIV